MDDGGRRVEWGAKGVGWVDWGHEGVSGSDGC